MKIIPATYCYRLFFFRSSDLSTSGWTDMEEGREGMVGEERGRRRADLALRTRMVSTLASLLGRAVKEVELVLAVV